MPSNKEKKGPATRRSTRVQTKSELNLGLGSLEESAVHSTPEPVQPKDDSQTPLAKPKPAEKKSRKIVHEKKVSKEPYPTSKSKDPKEPKSSRGSLVNNTRSPTGNQTPKSPVSTVKATNKLGGVKNSDGSKPLEKGIKQNQQKDGPTKRKRSLDISGGKVSKPGVKANGEKAQSIVKNLSLPKPMARPSSSQLDELFFTPARGQVKVYRKSKVAGSFLKLPGDDNRTAEQRKAHADRIKEEELSMRRIRDFKESLEDPEIEAVYAEGARQCPYCGDILELPFTPILEEAFKEMEDLDKAFEESLVDTEGSPRIMQFGIQKREVSNIEQFKFCQLHKTELKIKPEGVKNGYPLEIDFDSLPDRIKSLEPELERVITKDTPSTYRDTALQAYEDLGQVKARGTMAVMGRFEHTLPGYYGSKGAAIIQKVLDAMFIQTNILTHETAAPQLPMEYLQQVLVPETAYRLIREDLVKQGLESKDPKQVMKDSSEFGTVVHRDSEVVELH
ncbi:RTC4-like domain-containing protein [Phycomyces nitens]|nr:RTC4-like domain-containing protein [Phycomyces nitens]